MYATYLKVFRVAIFLFSITVETYFVSIIGYCPESIYLGWRATTYWVKSG